jgi:hypothetical protein
LKQLFHKKVFCVGDEAQKEAMGTRLQKEIDEQQLRGNESRDMGN